MRGELMREFKTANFHIIADALPEDDLDLSWDENGHTRAGLESGELIAFVARVQMIVEACADARNHLRKAQTIHIRRGAR